MFRFLATATAISIRQRPDLSFFAANDTARAFFSSARPGLSFSPTHSGLCRNRWLALHLTAVDEWGNARAFIFDCFMLLCEIIVIWNSATPGPFFRFHQFHGVRMPQKKSEF